MDHYARLSKPSWIPKLNQVSIITHRTNLCTYHILSSGCLFVCLFLFQLSKKPLKTGTVPDSFVCLNYLFCLAHHIPLINTCVTELRQAVEVTTFLCGTYIHFEASFIGKVKLPLAANTWEVFPGIFFLKFFHFSSLWTCVKSIDVLNFSLVRYTLYNNSQTWKLSSRSWNINFQRVFLRRSTCTVHSYVLYCLRQPSIIIYNIQF